MNISSAAIPIACTSPSCSGFTGFLLIASTSKNTNLPPSSAGIGSRFITPRLALISTMKLIMLRKYGEELTNIIRCLEIGTKKENGIT